MYSLVIQQDNLTAIGRIIDAWFQRTDDRTVVVDVLYFVISAANADQPGRNTVQLHNS
jgi:hypothetical protein